MDYIENLVLWSLALYGILQIIKMILKKFTKKNNKYMIITVKNGENYIEGILRSILFNDFYANEDPIKQILVIDLNSKDDTISIVKKMESENKYIKLLEWEEFKNLIDSKV